MDGQQSDDDDGYIISNYSSIKCSNAPRAVRKNVSTNSRIIEDSEHSDDTSTSSEKSPSQVIIICFLVFVPLY